jgi:hypothetical protein
MTKRGKDAGSVAYYVRERLRTQYRAVLSLVRASGMPRPGA